MFRVAGRTGYPSISPPSLRMRRILDSRQQLLKNYPRRPAVHRLEQSPKSLTTRILRPADPAPERKRQTGVSTQSTGFPHLLVIVRRIVIMPNASKASSRFRRWMYSRNASLTVHASSGDAPAAAPASTIPFRYEIRQHRPPPIASTQYSTHKGIKYNRGQAAGSPNLMRGAMVCTHLHKRGGSAHQQVAKVRKLNSLKAPVVPSRALWLDVIKQAAS